SRPRGPDASGDASTLRNPSHSTGARIGEARSSERFAAFGIQTTCFPASGPAGTRSPDGGDSTAPRVSISLGTGDLHPPLAADPRFDAQRLQSCSETARRPEGPLRILW